MEGVVTKELDLLICKIYIVQKFGNLHYTANFIIKIKNQIRIF